MPAMRPLALLLATALAHGLAWAQPVPTVAGVPVIIGNAGEDFDACPSFGELRGSVPLRAAPSTQAPAAVTLPRGAGLHVCSESDDGRWLGVVVASDAADCGVSSAVPRPRRYRGPCPSGWVPARSVRMIAG